MQSGAPKLKLDLHVHPCEALGQPWLNEKVVRRLVEEVKFRGLDGIALTEHEFPSYAFRFKDLAEQIYRDGEGVVIIPGQEISAWPVEIVELYFPDDLVFRFLAHPGFPPTDFTRALHLVQGIEIANALHTEDMDREKIRAAAEAHNLLMLKNSDAHSLAEIGRYYNEIALETLISRARPGRPRGMRR